jgi:hypothetical protein
VSGIGRRNENGESTENTSQSAQSRKAEGQLGEHGPAEARMLAELESAKVFAADLQAASCWRKE